MQVLQIQTLAIDVLEDKQVADSGDKKGTPMAPADLPYTSEEEVIAEQFVKNIRLVAECDQHPGTYYRVYPGRKAIEKIDHAMQLNTDKPLTLIKRSELQKKALVMVVLRKYEEKCPLCPVH